MSNAIEHKELGRRLEFEFDDQIPLHVIWMVEISN